MDANFAKLKPLSGSSGLKTFTEMRDPSERSNGDKTDKTSKKRSTMDSDDEIDEGVKLEEGESAQDSTTLLSPEDARRQGELAEGVQKIRVRYPFPTVPSALPPSSSPPFLVPQPN